MFEENMKKMADMDDNQLNSMLDMMKNNKEMMKQMYRAQGMNLSDD